MNDRQKRLNHVFDYLRLHGKVKTQKDLAQVIGMQRTGISAALNGNDAYLTDGLFLKIYAAFPDMFNREWLLRGENEKKPETSIPESNGNNSNFLEVYATLIKHIDDLRIDLTAELDAVRQERAQLHQERETLRALMQQLLDRMGHPSVDYEPAELHHRLVAESSTNSPENDPVSPQNEPKTTN